MRSELVFGATAHVPNRYLLVRLTSKTTRMFHKPNARLEETANDALRIFSCAKNEDALSRRLFTEPKNSKNYQSEGLPR
jgi:hypothetical protein